MAKKDVDLVLLGTPYFASDEKNIEPSEAQIEQTTRFGAVLGEDITDPMATFHLWRETASQVFPFATWPPSQGYTKIASFREGCPFDSQGVVRISTGHCSRFWARI